MSPYAANELFASSAGLGSGLRAFPSVVQPKTFASGSGVLLKLTPLTFSIPLTKWILWAGGISQVNAITANATPATDGTFTITVNGQTTAAIDHDAIAATVETALELLSNVPVGEATVAEVGGGLSDANDGVTITFSGSLGEQEMSVTADFSGLTGNVHVLTESTTGVSNRIDGLIWPDAVTLDASDDVLGQVMMAGRVHVDDIVTPAGETTGSLKAALRNTVARNEGLILEGLDSWR